MNVLKTTKETLEDRREVLPSPREQLLPEYLRFLSATLDQDQLPAAEKQA